MYAMEMANLQKTAENAVAEAQAGVAQAETKYMDCTMMGLQMLRGKYGAQSEEFKAAYKALLQLAGGIMDDLCSCHEDRVVGQVMMICPGKQSSLLGL